MSQLTQQVQQPLTEHTRLPPPPHPREGEGAFPVVVEDCEEVDFTTYFSDSDSEDEWENIKDTAKSDKNSQMNWAIYKSEDIYIYQIQMMRH